jgi:hypothetical protein
MATVVTSIGSNSSIDTETPSSCSGSFSPYSVTFSTTPTGVNIGDKVEIEDQSSYYSTFTYRVTGISGTSYTLVYVTDTGSWGDVSPCDLLDFSWGQAPATFKRFYTSIANWEAGLDDSDVYSSSDIAVGECHNDSVFNEYVQINGGGTVGLASVTLSVHSGSRHDGTAGTGARIVPTSTPINAGVVNIYRDDVTVEWLEISGASATSYGNVGVRITSDADSNIFIRNNIIHDMNDASTVSIGIYDAGGGGTSRYVMNNFVYNINRSTGDSFGIYAYTSSGFGIYCNTVFNVTSDTDDASGIYVRNSTSGIAKDNICLGVTGGGTGSCFEIGTGSANAASDYNLSDDATAWGSNSVTSADGATAANTIANTSGGSEDLHLKAGSYAIEAGVDLGTTPTGVEIDIDGRNRDSEGDTWDIGADQTLATGVTITPAAAAFELAGVSPSVVQSSLTITVAVAAFALAGITPTTLNGSISLTPSAAAFELAGVSPSVIVPESVTPAAASFELAGVSPTAVAGSLSLTPSVAAVEFAGVSPSVQLSSISLTPSASAFELAGISPTVSISSASITPAVAVVEFAGISPSVLLSSLSVTPSASAFDFAAVDPSVGLSSLTVAPAASAVEFVGVSPSTILGGLSLTPSVASLEFAGISPTVTRSSVSVTPAAAITNYQARYAAVISGGIVVVPVTEAQFVYTAVDPAVGMSSQTVAVAASAFELAGVTPSTINGSITVSPAVSVVEFAASVATIHAGVEVTPAVAAFEYIVGVFTLHVTMDSASLGYDCDGLVDYRVSIPCDYEIIGVLDYIAGVLPTDYQLEKNLDYRYDHQS